MSILPEEYSKPVTIGYFQGKVCTVLVDRLAPFQTNMTPEEATQTFTGVVNNITSQGVCITDLTTKTRNFFFFNHIVGLREEKVLDPDDPNDQQEIALIQQAMEITRKKGKIVIRPDSYFIYLSTEACSLYTKPECLTVFFDRELNLIKLVEKDKPKYSFNRKKRQLFCGELSCVVPKGRYEYVGDFTFNKEDA